MVARTSKALAPRLPRPRKRRILPAEVRVDDLMSAAAGLFIAKGIDATTVDEIVARAGAAKGTFYHYFPTKTDVILALRERFSRDFITRAAAAIDASPPEDFPARLSAWLRGAVETYLANFELHDVVFHDFTHSRRQSKEKDSVISQLVELLDEGKTAGAWSFPDARAAALILFDGMHGVVDDSIASGQRDSEHLCHLLSEMFLSMLSTRSDTASVRA